MERKTEIAVGGIHLLFFSDLSILTFQSTNICTTDLIATYSATALELL